MPINCRASGERRQALFSGRGGRHTSRDTGSVGTLAEQLAWNAPQQPIPNDPLLCKLLQKAPEGRTWPSAERFKRSQIE